MTVSLIGGHFTRNGLGQGYPARVVLSLNGNGLDEQHPDTIVVYRDTTVYNDGPPDLHHHPLRRSREFAQYWYDRLRPIWQANSHRAHYFTITNEIGGSDPEHIQDGIAFEGHICALAAADGLKCAVGKLAGDSPAWGTGLWQQYYAPFLTAMWHQYGAIYARHAYGGGNLMVGSDPVPGSPARPFNEIAHLRALGYGGGIVLAECGLDGGYGRADYGRFREQALNYALALKPHADMLIGLCWWECGQTGFNANYTDHLQQLRPELDTTLPKWTPAAVPPPANKPKVVIVKKPQKAAMSQPENQAIADWAWDNYGRTTTHSTDDTLTMLAAGNTESYAVIPFPDRQQDDIARLTEAGYRWQPMDGNPLAGLHLGHLFAYRYQLTSPFNSPRSYGPHEGADYDIIGGQANNTTMVLCTYPGVVDRSLDSSGGYGKYVRVRHTRFGKTFYTRYCHLDSRVVAVGDAVAAGTAVGEVGTTGNVTGEHVHFNLEVPGYGLPGYVVADVVDPAPYLPTPAEMASLPPVPTGTVDMSIYFFPANGTTHSDIFTLSNNWGQGPERCQLQRAGNVSYVTKNQQYEKRTVGNVSIALNMDTSPGGGEYYTVESPTGWMPRTWAPGQTFTRQETTRFFRKSDCGFLRQSNWSTPLTFERIHPTWTSQAGITLANVAELSWFAGGRVDERYWFAPGLGLVAWEKYDGKRSWISELIPRGSQQDNVREVGCFG